MICLFFNNLQALTVLVQIHAQIPSDASPPVNSLSTPRSSRTWGSRSSAAPRVGAAPNIPVRALACQWA